MADGFKYDLDNLDNLEEEIENYLATMPADQREALKNEIYENVFTAIQKASQEIFNASVQAFRSELQAYSNRFNQMRLSELPNSHKHSSCFDETGNVVNADSICFFWTDKCRYPHAYNLRPASRSDDKK